MSDEWSPSYYGQSGQPWRNSMDEYIHFFDIDKDGTEEWLVPILGFIPENMIEESGKKSRSLTVMKKLDTGWEYTEISASDNGLPYQNPEFYKFRDEDGIYKYVAFIELFGLTMIMMAIWIRFSCSLIPLQIMKTIAF